MSPVNGDVVHPMMNSVLLKVVSATAVVVCVDVVVTVVCWGKSCWSRLNNNWKPKRASCAGETTDPRLLPNEDCS